MGLSALLEELRAVLWSVWNRRWIALAVAWGICLLGWLAVAMVPNSYESTARIYVQLDDVLAQQIGIGSGERRKDLDRVRQTLTSAINLQRVVRSTRLGDGVSTPNDMERAVTALADNVGVSSMGDNLFIITAESGRGEYSDKENAQLAQTIVQKMIDIFREENLGGTREDMRDTLSFIDQQLAEREQQLQEAETKRQAFETANPDLVGGTPAIAAKLSATRAELRSVEADLAAAQSALAAIDGQIASTPRVITSPDGSGPQAALAQAEANMAQMKSQGFKDTHPDVVAAKRQIEVLRKQAAAAGPSGGTTNPAYSSLQSIRVERQANMQALRSRAAALQAELAQISGDLADEPGAAAEAQRISRDYDVLRKQYDKLLQDREELRLRGQVESERSAIRFEVIDPPSTPRAPSAPPRALLLAAVLIFGVGAGAAVAFALGQLNSSFATVAKLEKTFGLPVIGAISRVRTEAVQQRESRHLKYFAAATGGLGVIFLVLIALEIMQRGMMA
ncbi:XrtA system polysaccharide chain length determinant [Altericroceibacterium endophyticum]|uniref:Chain-length determining protein n=1 Tax=Altericroceibacterium endophyticum TaxID=1808508 RepID=A0A6I4T7C8_9SPHN|nr:XrtA system polysaccharide chain length determinant [Altericroceibacterium endophyticum]MXO66031.1 chain-length determining protein [Altericroceibacterium endophyticum]